MKDAQAVEVTKPAAKFKSKNRYTELVIILLSAIAIVAIYIAAPFINRGNNFFVPNKQSTSLITTPKNYDFNISFESAKQFTVGDSKRVIVELTFSNGDNTDFWFLASDVIPQTTNTAVYYTNYQMVSINNMYKVPAKESIHTEFAWDMPKEAEFKTIFFNNYNKYGYTISVPTISETAIPAAILDEQKDCTDCESVDKTAKEYQDLKSRLTAFDKGTLAGTKVYKLPEIRASFIGPADVEVELYDDSTFAADINKGIETWYTPDLSLVVNKETLSPEQEFTYTKRGSYNFTISSTSKLSVFRDNFFIYLDCFPSSSPTSIPQNIQDAYQETKNIGGKKVHIYTYWYNNGNEYLNKTYVIDLGNGHTLSLVYNDVISDQLLKTEDKQLRYQIIDKIVSSIEVY